MRKNSKLSYSKPF